MSGSQVVSNFATPSPSQVLPVPASSPPVVSTPPMPLRKSARDIKPPAYLQDYACATFAPSAPYDLAKCLTYSHLEPGYQSYLMTVAVSHGAAQTVSHARRRLASAATDPRRRHCPQRLRQLDLPNPTAVSGE
ncbi:hypothetical protein CMV_002968 [Castanea mollissima]|uniref:Uncharacterized protein n=1 Tax=Castanea mollissima TaxID=60419 RepID=A0A8J4W5N1_9ROSI|nr:hypothetical protein CMV_002968 [Castanea mollissima]